MKKSELLNLAQIAVVTSPCITPANKLQILRVLMENEDLEIYIEKEKAKKEETQNAETV